MSDATTKEVLAFLVDAGFLASFIKRGNQTNEN